MNAQKFLIQQLEEAQRRAAEAAAEVAALQRLLDRATGGDTARRAERNGSVLDQALALDAERRATTNGHKSVGWTLSTAAKIALGQRVLNGERPVDVVREAG